MKKLREYIRKEIQSLHEQKSYPVPLDNSFKLVTVKSFCFIKLDAVTVLVQNIFLATLIPPSTTNAAIPSPATPYKLPTAEAGSASSRVWSTAYEYDERLLPWANEY